LSDRRYSYSLERRRHRSEDTIVDYLDYITEDFSFGANIDEWREEGLSVRIPKSVIELVVRETVKRMVTTMYTEQIRDTVRNSLVNMILIPLAIMMSVFSAITFLVLVMEGAFVISIPFALTTLLGIYYYFLKKSEQGEKR